MEQIDKLSTMANRSNSATLNIRSKDDILLKESCATEQGLNRGCLDTKLLNKTHKEQKQFKHRRSKSHTAELGFTIHRSISSPAGNGSNVVTTFNTKPQSQDIDFLGFETGKDLTVNGSDFNRLVIVSSKVRNNSSIRHALMPGVNILQYNYDTQTLDHLECQIGQLCGGQKLRSIAFLLSCSGSCLLLTGKDEKIINKDGVLDETLCKFFSNVSSKFMESKNSLCRLDFLGWCSLQNTDVAPPVVAELQSITGVTVGVWQDLSGQSYSSKRGEDKRKISIGDMYLRLDKLRSWSGRHQQSLAGFEKIRTVGKGAYGTAVLYKKKDDESLVILKEINMHDLNVSERQLALNEVSVLAMLDHPNIISYYDSFEEDGVLMIEIEYADNGTLKQLLDKQEKPMEEKDILLMFQQIVAAIRHIHSHNVLHRDLKTDNIFLTKEGVVKVGDFGISKMLGSTNIGAQTVLGTPYYISPEMCEGKQYSFKSDIWALGCILYEMACFQKTFEGSNLPAVVNKIMKVQFSPVKGNYSDGFKDLICDMLKKNPDERPEANHIMYHRLPTLMSIPEKEESETDIDPVSPQNFSKKTKIRSVLYYLESSTAAISCINDLPPRMKIKHMAVGPEHVIVATTERQVFTWGCGGHGELGHGDYSDRFSPMMVETLQGKSVANVCCGLGYSVFGSDNGLVLTCGDGRQGCLGHGDWCTINKPRLVESLLSFDAVAMASGQAHVVIIGQEGQVMSWGNGSHGQLGLGSEENQCTPSTVPITESVVFTDVQCSVDGTILISDVGGVFACGRNENNKLGLNNRQGFLMAMKNIFTKTEVDGTNTPTPVRALARHRVLAVSMGKFHTAVIVEPGHVITFGKNSEGQLGTLNTKPSSNPVEVKALESKYVAHVQCGDHYTIASTREHELYYWGLRYTSPLVGYTEDTTSQSSCNDSTNFTSSNLTDKCKVDNVQFHSQLSSSGSAAAACVEDDVNTKAKIDNSERCGDLTSKKEFENAMPDPQGFRPLSSYPKRSASASSQENSKDKEKEKEQNKTNNNNNSIISLQPAELIKIKQGNEKMILGNIYTHGENIIIQIETTAPPPRRRTFRKRIVRRRSNHSLMSPALSTSSDGHIHNKNSLPVSAGDYSCSSDTSELEGTHSAIPTWLREELAECARSTNDGNEADDTSGHSDDEQFAGGQKDSSMSSIHINRALTPVAADSVYGHGQHDTQNFIRADRCSPRNAVQLTSPRNLISGHVTSQTIPSSKSYEKDKRTKFKDDTSGSQSFKEESRSTKSEPNTKLSKLSKKRDQKPLNFGSSSARVHETNGKSGTRGFISDVTARRREEALMMELERVKKEKREADDKVRKMEREREAHQSSLKQDTNHMVGERETYLVAEVERLRSEIQAQSALLMDRELQVGQLQSELDSVLGQGRLIDRRGNSAFKEKTNSLSSDRLDSPDILSNQTTPRADSSASSSSSSAPSRRSNSRLCVIQ